MTTSLTSRQRAIYDFIVDRVRGRGIPPSLTEIAEAFELASASGVADHLRAIERKGYIRRRPGMSRGIELTRRRQRGNDSDTAVRVPVIGTLPARKPLSTEGRKRRHLLFDGRLAGQGALAVRINLSGLERHGILRGDYVIVLSGAKPATGELAVGQIGRGTILVEMLPGRRGVRRVDDATVHRDEFELMGRVIAVLRSMNELTRTYST